MALNQAAIGTKIGPLKKSYTWRDVVLYALGVGAGFNDLDYCWESRLKVIPSFSIGAVFDFLAEAGLLSEADLTGILHGEQDIIFHNPIPVDGELITEGAITDMFDKGPGKGALVRAEAETFHSNGKKLFTNVFTLFCRKDGGFGGLDAPKEEVDYPDREPDFEEPDLPGPNQPLLYRLSGDIFQLHVDPEFARAVGFERPILHGLCTHGYACRAVIKHLFPGEPERIKRFRTRFSKPIYPGVPIVTRIWKISEGLAYFKVLNAHTKEIVIDRGIVEWLTPHDLALREQRRGIRFDDRVAVITGAGAGLGKVYALEFARRGAKVVVNDFGGARDGSGETSNSPADNTVAEILALGGEAVADYTSSADPEGGRQLVENALKTFGHIDILVCNAGILRDKTLAKMSPEDWRTVNAVHLDAAYNIVKPATAAMRKAGYGRIVLTTSAAGLYGNFGQTNYSAAKMGLVGFMNALRLETEKHGIKVNIIAPIAATRLTEDILPPDLTDKLKPEFIAPLVLYLASEVCPVNGTIYNAGMGFYGKAAILTNKGVYLGGSGIPTPEQIARNIDAITDMTGALQYWSATEALGAMLEAASSTESPEPKARTSDVASAFGNIAGAFRADQAAGVNVVFQYKISGQGGGDWNVEIKDGTCKASKGVHASPNVTLAIGDLDFMDLIAGKLNPMKAYTSGKLKIQGDLAKSRLIEKLFKFK